MPSVLEELYNGNIRPGPATYPRDSPFVQAARAKHENLERLMAALSDDEKEWLDQYCEAEGDIQGITRYDTFTYALKFGILLMTEVFMGRGEVTGAEE